MYDLENWIYTLICILMNREQKNTQNVLVKSTKQPSMKESTNSITKAKNRKIKKETTIKKRKVKKVNIL